FGLMSQGVWNQNRGSNLLDGGAHFYGTYETKDGKHVSLGSIEPQFYALLLEKTGLDQDPDLAKQMSRDDWPMLRQKLAGVMATKTRDEWDAIMLGTDICYAPILNFEEAVEHPHNQARQTFVQSGDITQAAPAPRFSRTEPQLPEPPVAPGQHTDEILAGIGLDATAIANLKDSGAVA
ncbi:MAG: CoA transferase, partial [Pseudomonadota bacterium]|nr:CoA transferase [Pseudomonadota bacterium]